MRALPLILLLPCLVGWNGSGPAVLDIQRAQHGATETFRSEAVCSGHPDRLEVVIVVEMPGDGDGVLSLRIPREFHNRDLELPYPDVRVRYHEYAGDGGVRFAGTRLLRGDLRVDGNPRGSLQLDFELVFTNGETERLIIGDSRLVAIDWEPVSGTNRGREVDDPAPEGYYEGGCYGTYYESDYDDDSYYADEDYGDSGSGCGDDDLDDDGPSGSSGGCDSSADDDGYDDYGDDSDSGGCEGDDVDSDDSWDDSDDSGGCEGDNVDAFVAGCARGGPGGPWIGRLIRWIPWMCVFLAIRLMRRRRPQLTPA